MRTRLTLLTLLLNFNNVFAQKPVQSYSWKSVAIHGGGYVTGFTFSKAAKNLLYARTDVGGAYRWNNTDRKWIPLSDFVTDMNQLGVVSIAADPNDSNRVYMTTGLYTASWAPYGVMYSSTDKGLTWTGVRLPFKVGGNSQGRGTGERLQVDPNMSNRLLFGSQTDGLYESLDYGKTWTKQTNFPKSRCTFVEFYEPSSKKGTATKEILVGTCDNFFDKDTTIGGLYRSIDAGISWQYMTGQSVKTDPKPYDKVQTSSPAVPNNLVFAGDNIFITVGNDLAPAGGLGHILKYNRTSKNWTKINPELNPNSQGGFSGLTVHPSNPNILMVATLGRWWPTTDAIYITTDGGATWRNTRAKLKVDSKNTPHGGSQSWICGLHINPFNPNHAVFGTGNGLNMTFELNKTYANDTTTWIYENDNFEETVTSDLVSPPSGAQLLSCVGDRNGFVHADLNVSPPNFRDGSTGFYVDFAEQNPQVIVRTHSGTTKASLSRNGGATWSAFPTIPVGDADKVAISPDGTTIVWSPKDSVPFYSTNDGNTWTKCNNLTANGTYIRSDRVNSQIIYAVKNSADGFYRSNDGGKSFTKTAASFTFNPMNLEMFTVFGKEGHIWISAGNNGLYYSTNGGDSFAKIASVDKAFQVSFGKAATGASYPFIFIYGEIENAHGLFRSDDLGVNWVKINTKHQEFGRNYPCIAGDPKTYGRLYIGTRGRGILYGDVQGDGTCYEPNLGNDITICRQSFTPIKSNAIGTGYTYVWYKDGVKLATKTSPLFVSEPGKYDVTASKAGCPSMKDYILVESRLLKIENPTICQGQFTSINLSRPSTYQWQDAKNNPLDTSSISFNISPTKTSNYFVKDIATTEYLLGQPSYTGGGWAITSGFDGNSNKLKLTVSDDVRLKSISVYVNRAGTNVVIRVVDANGQVVVSASKTNLGVGLQTIPFDNMIGIGTFMIDAVGTVGSIQYQTTRVTNYVPSIANFASIAPQAVGVNGLFYNLKIETGDNCAPTPFTVTVNPSPVVTITSPANNATLATDIFPINASVTGTNMSNVTFYNGSSLLVVDATSPYSFTTSSLANGTYTFSTIAKNTFNCTDTAKVMVKVNKVITEIKGQEIVSTDLICYPNPFQNEIHIHSKGGFKYVLMNATGQEIEKGIGNDELSIGKSLDSGFYILMIDGMSGKRNFKLIKN